MTVRRAPAPQPRTAEKPEELDFRTEAFINKGMQAHKDDIPKHAGTTKPTKPTKPTKVLLTIPAQSHARIEAVLAGRRVRIPRHTWLLEAIVEKLEREEPKAM